MKKMHVYSHTHWDYEWYFTASESLVQLIYHMDEVITALEKGILKNYLLDSQTSILEEYLQVMPEKTEIVKKLVSEGKLMVGPWYTQTDELIINGESLARNLFYGINSAKDLGKCMMIGYLPDSFGQSKDMPKLYRQFDIENALFWRGVPRDVCNRREFYWNSEDGNKVLCYNIKDGYFYGGNLIYTDDVEKVEKRILAGAETTNQLLPLGGDQRYVDFNLEERLKYYNDRSSYDIHYFESNLEDFFKELKEESGLPEIEGEFIDASDSKIHHSIYSTRYDHKQLNDRIERRMTYQLEPFMVMQSMLGIEPKTSVLEKLWKKILLNHAHDSACGCNSDQTNESILQRLLDCDQMSQMMLDYQVRKLSESFEGIENNDFIVYNTLPYSRDCVHKLEVITKNPTFCIVDEDGKHIDFDVLSSMKEYSGSIRKDVSTYKDELYFYRNTISIRLNLNPMSYAVLHIQEGEYEVNVPAIENDCIENEFYRIENENGHLNLILKHSNHKIEDFITFEDCGDEGDTYDYSWSEEDRQFVFGFVDSNIEMKKGLHCSYVISQGIWNIPETLKDRITQSNMKEVPFEFKLMIDHSDLIQCQIELENQSIEHRLRMVCKGIDEGNHSISDTIFGMAKRENNPSHMSDWKEIGYREEPTPIYPVLHHVSVGEETQLTCFLKGIKEFEVLNNRDIALTLFRSVPLLGRPDLNRRPGIASGNEFKYIATPKSEMKQKMTFEVAMAYRVNDTASNLHKTWLIYANDVLSYQIQEMDRFINTQKYFVTHPYQVAGECIKKKSVVVANLDESPNMTYSTLYPLDKNTALLRVYNDSNEYIELEEIYVEANSVVETNMLHENLKNCLFDNNILKITNVKPGEIRNYKINLK